MTRFWKPSRLKIRSSFGPINVPTGVALAALQDPRTHTPGQGMDFGD